MGRHLLIPMQPTPNGLLHIGHGGGPYLHADVLARAIRRDGGEASIVTGTDAYESWVLADSLRSGRTPVQTCARFYSRIKNDLDNLGVHLEEWVDPLGAVHRNPYLHLHEELLRQLRSNDAAQLRTERVPLGSRTGRPITGVWIAGHCPTCGAACGGNTCTACGDSFSPDEILDPRSRLDNEPVTWAEQENWFVQPARPAAIIASLEATGLQEQFLRPARHYIEQRQARTRLSQPGTWGIPSAQAPSGSVLTNTYYAYSLYCAQLYARRHGDSVSALHRDSDVTVIGLFGTDNSITGLVTPHVIAAAGDTFKAHDHTVVNHMLHFEGRKCSTSQMHGLWISALIETTSLTSDELRYALCHAPLDRAVTDITAQEITDHVNRLRRWRGDQLATATEAAHGAPSPRLLTHLNSCVERQQQHLAPTGFDLAAATAVLDDWLFDTTIDHRQQDTAAGWAIGTAILIAPIMPQLAQTLWNTLGLSGEPSTATLAGLSVQRSSATTADSGATSGLLTTSEITAHTRP